MDEGVIKFNFNRVDKPIPKNLELNSILDLRLVAFQKGLVGAYDNGLGYGNVSSRVDGLQFIITGSQTGEIKDLTSHHLVFVNSVDELSGEVNFIGTINGSSESLTHYYIYKATSCEMVLHIHNREIWQTLLEDNTPKVYGEYGSSELSQNIEMITKGRDEGVVVMPDHEEGVIIYGNTHFILNTIDKW